MIDTSSDRGLTPAVPARTSGWSIAALLCSLTLFCPLLTLLGPLFAIRALTQIKADSSRRGRGLAIAAILIGLTATGFWAVGGVWWHVRVRTPMILGPIRAIQSGQSGDLAGFRAGFFGEAARADDEMIQRYLGELSNRYGRLLAIRQRESDGTKPAVYQMQSYRIAYEMVFETGPIRAEAEFVISAPDGSGFVGRFAWLAIIDPDLGDLVFPASAASEAFGPLDAGDNVTDGN